MPGVDSTVVTLRGAPTAAAQARRLVAARCRAAGIDGDAQDSALLLTSEVVTNAVIHGRSEVRLSVHIEPGLIRVAVGDDNSRHPKLETTDPDALDGRGLAIVEMLAARWGVADDPIGKTVWFELPARSLH